MPVAVAAAIAITVPVAIGSGGRGGSGNDRWRSGEVVVGECGGRSVEWKRKWKLQGL